MLDRLDVTCSMPRQRFSLHFAPERPEDRPVWEAFLAELSSVIGLAAEMGERRPLIEVAAPFKALSEIQTRRDEELRGLAIARDLLAAASRVAARTGRTIVVLLGGRTVGRVDAATGVDAAVAAMLDEWQALLDKRPPDEPEWERAGWVSVWAGAVGKDEMDRLFAERYGTGGPISPFARALGIAFYDHDFLEVDQHAQAIELVAAVARRSFAASFVDAIPDDLRTRPVTAIAVLYDTDFSQRPASAARGRLAFIGSFPYRAE